MEAMEEQIEKQYKGMISGFKSVFDKYTGQAAGSFDAIFNSARENAKSLQENFTKGLADMSTELGTSEHTLQSVQTWF